MSRAPIRYVRGDHKAVCDGCGKYFLASELRKRWDGMMVCSSDYEIRHPQDFVRARQDQQAVAWSRPSPPDIFLPVHSVSATVGVAVVGVVIVGSPIGSLLVPPGTFTP